MKHSWEGHKYRNRHKNRIKRSEQARLVYDKDINRNITTTRSCARVVERDNQSWLSLSASCCPGEGDSASPGEASFKCLSPCHPQAVESRSLFFFSVHFSKIFSALKLVRWTQNVLLRAVWVGGIFSSPRFRLKIAVVLIHQPSSFSWSCCTTKRPSEGFVQYTRSTEERQEIVFGLWIRSPNLSCLAISFAGKKRRRCHSPSWQKTLATLK